MAVIARVASVANRVAGITDTVALLATAVGGESVSNDGTVFARFQNGSVSPITVTLAWGALGLLDTGGNGAPGVAPAAKTFTVPASDGLTVGPFPKTLYNDVNGLLQFTFSGVTTLKSAYFYNRPE